MVRFQCSHAPGRGHFCECWNQRDHWQYLDSSGALDVTFACGCAASRGSERQIRATRQRLWRTGAGGSRGKAMELRVPPPLPVRARRGHAGTCFRRARKFVGASLMATFRKPGPDIIDAPRRRGCPTSDQERQIRLLRKIAFRLYWDAGNMPLEGRRLFSRAPHLPVFISGGIDV